MTFGLYAHLYSYSFHICVRRTWICLVCVCVFVSLAYICGRYLRVDVSCVHKHICLFLYVDMCESKHSPFKNTTAHWCACSRSSSSSSSPHAYYYFCWTQILFMVEKIPVKFYNYITKLLMVCVYFFVWVLLRCTIFDVVVCEICTSWLKLHLFTKQSKNNICIGIFC